MSGLQFLPIPAVFSPLPRALAAERFLVAVAAAVAAIVLRAVLDPILGHVAFYVTVYIAVAYCVLVCGAVPAAVTCGVGFLGVLYWFVDPRHSLRVTTWPEIHGMIGFFLVSFVLIALGEATRKKQLQLNESVIALEKEAEERRRAEAALLQSQEELERRVKQRTTELSLALEKVGSEVDVRRQAEEHLRQLSIRLMTLQDDERRRIARELHDTTGQTLAALKLSLASLEKLVQGAPLAPGLFDDLNALADEAAREIRTTSYLLHPPLLDEAGFASAASWFVEGFAKRSNIQVQLELSELAGHLSKECELVLFRILQESLTNVHRHAKASAAVVKVLMNRERLQFLVQDNGRGIDEQGLRRLRESGSGTGVGLAGMRERVRQLGGMISIQSDSTGTTVRVELPTWKIVRESAGHGIPAA